MNMKRLLTVLTTVLMMLGLCFPAYSQIETSSAEEAGAVIGQTEDPFVGADFDPQIAAENGYSIEMTEEGDYKITQGAAGILEAVLNLVKIFFFNLLVSFLIIQEDGLLLHLHDVLLGDVPPAVPDEQPQP